MSKSLTLIQFTELAVKNLLNKATPDEIKISLKKGDLLELGYDCSVNDINKINEMCPTPESKQAFTDMAESMIIERATKLNQHCIEYGAIGFNHLDNDKQQQAYYLWFKYVKAPMVKHQIEQSISDIAIQNNMLISKEQLTSFLDNQSFLMFDMQSAFDKDQMFMAEKLNYAYNTEKEILLPL